MQFFKNKVPYIKDICTNISSQYNLQNEKREWPSDNDEKKM